MDSGREQSSMRSHPSPLLTSSYAKELVEGQE